MAIIRSYFPLLYLVIGLLVSTTSSAYIITSNKPLALIAATVYPTEEIQVLLPDGMSPHDYSLKPSDIRRIRNAEYVIWSGTAAEMFLTKLADSAVTPWISVNSLVSQSIEGTTDGNQHHDHSRNADPHIWLSANHAKALHIELAKLYGKPVENKSFVSQLDSAIEQGQELLAQSSNKGFMVYHPAYHHWQSAMQLVAPISVTHNPEQKVGLKHFRFLKEQIAKNKVSCIVTEPQFDQRLIQRLMANNGQSVSRITLDPLASHIAVTSTAYAEWYLDMAKHLSDCLGN